MPNSLKNQIAEHILWVLAASILLLFAFTLILKITKNHRKHRDAQFRLKLENKLNILIAAYESYDDKKRGAARNVIRKMANKNWKRAILAEMLVHYKINLSGIADDISQELYLATGLQNMAIRHLRGGNVTKKITAMRYLSEMRYAPAAREIMKYLNHKRKLLRVESSLALVHLTERPLFFLDQLRRNLTTWQKINIYKKLKELPVEQIPDFSQWFYSPNKSVALFALEMTGWFNQAASAKQVGELLMVDDIDIQAQAIRTLVAIEAFQYADYFASLLKITRQQPLIIELLKAVGEISMDTDHLDAVRTYLLHPVHEVRFQAARAIKRMERGEKYLAAYTSRYPEKLQSISRHLANPILN